MKGHKFIFIKAKIARKKTQFLNNNKKGYNDVRNMKGHKLIFIKAKIATKNKPIFERQNKVTMI